jgi:predicted amidophosphoribosyltransferase
MPITLLEFGSLLSYSPRGTSPAELYSKEVTLRLKKDEFVQNPPILMSEYLAQEIQRNLTNLPFASFFEAETIILVPIRKSCLMKPGEWWVPQNLAWALVRKHLGNDVEECLERHKPVPKSSIVPPKDRATPYRHYESLKLQKLKRTSKLKEILLIDDVVTTGSAFLGAANRLAVAFPDAHIRALAIVRTVSNPSDFVDLHTPVVGTIKLEAGQKYPQRRP